MRLATTWSSVPIGTGQLPSGIKQSVSIRRPQFSVARYRTQLFDPADMDNVKKVQAGYKVQPLSAYLKQPAPAAPAIRLPQNRQGNGKEEFFRVSRFFIAVRPARPGGKGNSRQARTHRRRSRQDFQFQGPPTRLTNWKLPSAREKAKPRSINSSRDHIKSINGWKICFGFSATALFLTATGCCGPPVRKVGIYGNIAEEATYPLTKTLADGEPLDGSKHNYTLTFAAGQFPPVNAFWSVTMYDGKTQFLIKNPIDRYLINSPMLSNMKKNADGSVTLYIQNKTPGADKGSKLAACSERGDLSGDAFVLAEDRTTFDLAPRQRHLAAAGSETIGVDEEKIWRTGGKCECPPLARNCLDDERSARQLCEVKQPRGP